ncbi:MAG: protein-disulfide reductase DsbD domain-containing protein, partial [Bryobacteraceae bacterium]
VPLAVLGACLCLPSLWAQGNQYLIAQAPGKLVAKRGASAEAKIAVSVEPGFHVNSNTPSDPYLIPLKLTWAPDGALEPGAVVFPKPQMEKYEFSDKPLSVFTGDFDLTAKFKVPAGASQGPGIMLGKLRYQACNNNSCFPPKTVEVRLSYQVQ